MSVRLNKIFKKITALSKKEGVPVYVVGGFVRDMLLDFNKKITDLDFVVEGSGVEFAKNFDELMKNEGSLILFEDFDTARYLFVDRKDKNKILIELEFAGARMEKYKKESRKPVVQKTSLEKDLSRRDFTVNTMAVPVEDFIVGWLGNKKEKNIIDPFDGQKDLKDKILKTPLDPDITFEDDPLRILRALRFAPQLNFGIDIKTLQAINNKKDRLKIISAERIKEELFKLLRANEPSVGLALMFQTGVMDIILPEISALDGVEEIFGQHHKNNLLHTFKVVDNIAERSDKVLLRLAGLLHDIGKPGTKKFVKGIGWTFYQHEHLGRKMVYDIARRLKFSKDETKYLSELVRWHQQPISLMDEGITDSAVRRLIVNLKDNLNDLLILGRSDITTGNPNKKEKRLKNYDNLEKKIEQVLEKDKLRAFQSPVRGEEIMDLCGLRPGPTVGKIKKRIEDAILDGEIANDYDEAKKYFEDIKGEYLQDVKDWEKL